MIITRLFVASILLFSTLYNEPKLNTPFIPPLRIPLLLSANFGELRIDHYHSGLDIKTQGVTGQDVLAAEDGFIYRISVSPGGFGNALYLEHPSGYCTVYGHLDRFIPAIEEYVKSQQYEKKSFQVMLYPAKDKFVVKQGELIAYSGNSGASGGPHLHFEIRKTVGEIPINPLLFNLGIADNMAPVIERLAIYPVNKNSYINNRQYIRKINVTGANGKYSIPSENEITISGTAGFGVKSYDLLNNSSNRCAIYSIELDIDSNKVFKYVMDGFSFWDTRYVNSHIDYETFMKENTHIERAFVLPNDKLGDYKDVVNRGLYNFNDNKTHKIKITVSDVDNNKSTLSFVVKSTKEKPVDLTRPKDSDLIVMPYDRTNKFSQDDISVNIPAGALYDTLNFDYRKNPGTRAMYSDLHSVHNIYTPLHKPYNLAIKPTSIPEGKESKLIIVELNENLSKKTFNSTWSEGFVKADVLEFGNFYIGIDTIPPTISANGLVPGANLTGKKEIRFFITDDFSGIKSYEGLIDGKWALFEFDQKNNLLRYRFDEKRITRGTKHNLSLRVTDNTNNFSFYNCEFTW